jgi:hypothetical protein
VCTPETPVSDALLLENFDPDFLVFERAETLVRAGVSSRVIVHVHASGEDGEPNGVDRGIVELFAKIARLPQFEIVPIRQTEPISFNAAVQIRDALLEKHVRSVVVIAPGFRSRRSALVYRQVLTPAGIRVTCDPVFGVNTLQIGPTPGTEFKAFSSISPSCSTTVFGSFPGIGRNTLPEGVMLEV